MINPQILWNYRPIDLAKSSREFSVFKLEVSLIENVRERISGGGGPMGLYLLQELPSAYSCALACHWSRSGLQ